MNQKKFSSTKEKKNKIGRSVGVLLFTLLALAYPNVGQALEEETSENTIESQYTFSESYSSPEASIISEVTDAFGASQSQTSQLDPVVHASTPETKITIPSGQTMIITSRDSFYISDAPANVRTFDELSWVDVSSDATISIASGVTAQIMGITSQSDGGLVILGSGELKVGSLNPSQNIPDINLQNLTITQNTTLTVLSQLAASDMVSVNIEGSLQLESGSRMNVTGRGGTVLSVGSAHIFGELYCEDNGAHYTVKIANHLEINAGSVTVRKQLSGSSGLESDSCEISEGGKLFVEAPHVDNHAIKVSRLSLSEGSTLVADGKIGVVCTDIFTLSASTARIGTQTLEDENFTGIQLESQSTLVVKDQSQLEIGSSSTHPDSVGIAANGNSVSFESNSLGKIQAAYGIVDNAIIGSSLVINKAELFLTGKQSGLFFQSNAPNSSRLQILSGGELIATSEESYAIWIAGGSVEVEGKQSQLILPETNNPSVSLKLSGELTVKDNGNVLAQNGFGTVLEIQSLTVSGGGSIRVASDTYYSVPAIQVEQDIQVAESGSFVHSTSTRGFGISANNISIIKAGQLEGISGLSEAGVFATGDILVAGLNSRLYGQSEGGQGILTLSSLTVSQGAVTESSTTAPQPSIVAEGPIVADGGIISATAYSWRLPDTAAIHSNQKISAKNEGEIKDNYRRTDTFNNLYKIPFPINPNIINFNNYTLSVSQGAIAIDPVLGIRATAAAQKSTLTAVRTRDYSTETIDLSGGGVHTITTFVNLVPHYILFFDANGGKNAPPFQKIGAENLATLPTTQPSRDGYNFVGWHFSPDGIGDFWDFSNTLMPPTDITLYAQWKEQALSEPEKRDPSMPSSQPSLSSLPNSQTLPALPSSSPTPPPALPPSSQTLPALPSSSQTPPPVLSSSTPVSSSNSLAETSLSNSVLLASSSSDYSQSEASLIAQQRPRPEQTITEQQRQETLEKIKSTGVPVFQIGDTEVPLFGGIGYNIWSLFDVAIGLLGTVFSIVILANRVREKKKKDIKALVLLSTALGFLAGIIVLIVSDFSGVMTIFSVWSLPLTLLVVGQFITKFWHNKSQAQVKNTI